MTQSIRKPRPRRIAADEALAWARNLRLRNPFAKTVVCMLALYVNGDGVCFVGIEHLAEDTELSPDTVRKRLAWLESVGAIVRLPQWVDGNGRRNGEGKGRRTSDEIRLLIDADLDAIEAKATGTGGDDVAAQPAQSDPGPQQGLNPGEDSVSPLVALGLPSDSGEGLDSSNPEPEPEESPPTPPSGGEWPHAESWKKFEETWIEPILHQTLCRQIWTALMDAERELVTRAASGYVAWRGKQRRPPAVCNAQKFLRERDAWQSYLATGNRVVPAAPEVASPDSDISRAWLTINTIAHIREPLMFGGKYSIPKPLTPQMLALATAPPQAEWRFIPSSEGHQVRAWDDLIRAALCGRARPPLVRDCREGRGFYAPYAWPPKQDGTIYATAPPGSSVGG